MSAKWVLKWQPKEGGGHWTTRPDGARYDLVPLDCSQFDGRSWGVWLNGRGFREVKQLETAKECARMDWEASQGIVTEPRRRGAA